MQTLVLSLSSCVTLEDASTSLCLLFLYAIQRASESLPSVQSWHVPGVCLVLQQLYSSSRRLLEGLTGDQGQKGHLCLWVWTMVALILP